MRRLESLRSLSYFTPALALAFCISSLAAFEVWRSYRSAQESAERSVRNLAHTLTEQTARTIQAVDFSLAHIRDTLRNSPSISDNDPDFRAVLKERLRTVPYIRALFVIGADGFISHDTDYPATPRVSLADRPYFKIHQDDPSSGLHIGQPLRSRSVNVWFVSLTRRIEKPEGDFGGVAVAALEPLYFERLYRNLSVGAEGAISLFLRDGTLLTRSPEPESAIGKSFAGSEPFRSQLEGKARGLFWSTSPIDSIRRVLAYEALEDAPIVVTVALAERAIMQSWREHATVVIIGAIVLLGMVAILAFFGMKHRLREELEQSRLARVQRLEAIGRLASGISHDFGNTLRIVRSTFSLLRPSLSDRSDALALVDQADHSLTGAQNLIDRLLAFARRQELRPRLTDLNTLIAGFIPILKQAAGPRNQIVFREASSHAKCLIDSGQFEAALLNLVLNSRDAAASGGVILLEVSLARQGHADIEAGSSNEGAQWAQVTVRDQSLGMSRDVLDHATEPFFTTKKEGEGSGLGLSQVLGFVQQSAGELHMESEEGKGTTVRLSFPLAVGEDGPPNLNRPADIP